MNQMSHRRLAVVVSVAALLTFAGCTSGDHETAIASTSGGPPKVRYSYDPLGRLVQAVAEDGTAAQYAYDEVGNITSIRRLAPGALQVVDVIPPSGLVGGAVTIYGSGFSATPSENTVLFNGTQATVSSATTTALTVNVPVGATTGKVTVTTSAASALSPSNFMVLTSSSAPGIASFTPVIGTQGTTVTVTGVNFQLRAQDDKVLLGGQLANVVRDASSPTATLLKFVVPSTTASGKVEITTPFGSATSSSAFFSLPAAVAPSDVEATGLVTVNGPAAGLTTTTAGKKLVLVFEGLAGQRLHLLATGGTFASPFLADVYGASPTKLQTFSMNNNSFGDFSAPLATSGTYTVVISPAASDHGAVQLAVVADVTGTLAVDGSTPVSLSPGQDASFSFTAEANTGYGLALPGLVFSPSGGSPSVTATLRKQDGTAVGSCLITPEISCDFDPATFATAGSYQLDLNNSGLFAASFNAVLSRDAIGTLVIDAPAPTTVTTTRPGQNARLTFSGTAGQQLTAVFNANTLDDGNATTVTGTQLLVLRPTGASAIASNSISTNSSGVTLDMTLPETGTYTVVIRPTRLDKGSLNLQLKAAVTGPLAVDGSTVISLSAGQNARFTFTAEANTGYGLAITGLAFTPSTGTPAPILNVTLRNAAGTSLATCPFSNNGSCDFEPASFATAGTYALELDPVALYAASFTAVLSTDARGTIAMNAAPITITIARPGQNARYTFTGTAGQSVNVVAAGSTLHGPAGPATSAQVSLLRANGASIASNTLNAVISGVALDATLLETGTYTVVLKPGALDVGTVDLRVLQVASGALALDGTTAINLAAGQNGRFSFTAQAGTGYGFAVSAISLTPGTAVPAPSVQVTLRKPDGTTELTTCPFTASRSCDFGPGNFATAGTYFIDFDPNGAIAATFDASLSTDVSGVLTIDGAAAAVTLARAGQNARYSFAGTAGQLVKVVVSGSTLDDGVPSTTNSTQVMVFKPSNPNAAPVNTTGFSTGTAGTSMNITLPETGNYMITISPSGLDSGALNLGVTHQ